MGIKPLNKITMGKFIIAMENSRHMIKTLCYRIINVVAINYVVKTKLVQEKKSSA